jgi:hypothetical protein
MNKNFFFVFFCFVNLITCSIAFGQWENGPIPPDNAVVGGHISDTAFPVCIGRIYERGNVHVGKVAFYNGRWSCFIGNGGIEQRYEQYQILVQKSDSYDTFSWSPLVNNQMLDNALAAGHISDTPHPVYIGRIYERDNVHVGKVAFYNGRWSCFIGNGGIEQRYETYQLLIKVKKHKVKKQ